MNESGPPIAAELRRLKIAPTHLLAVYVDIDLPVGVQFGEVEKDFVIPAFRERRVG